MTGGCRGLLYCEEQKPFSPLDTSPKTGEQVLTKFIFSIIFRSKSLYSGEYDGLIYFCVVMLSLPLQAEASKHVRWVMN